MTTNADGAVSKGQASQTKFILGLRSFSTMFPERNNISTVRIRGSLDLRPKLNPVFSRMSQTGESNSAMNLTRRPFLTLLTVLGLILSALFYRSFEPNQTLFSNDGPLGALMAYADVAPSFFTGSWHTLNWLGSHEPSALPNLTYGMYLIWGAVAHSKFFVPVALFLLGAGAWLFFRQLGLGTLAAVLGGAAAMLNTDPFSYACWGLPSLTLCMAATFFALAAAVGLPSRRLWLKLALAGLTLGMAIMEGYDNGAIFSLYVAAFVFFQAWISEPSVAKRWLIAPLQVFIVAIFSAFLAAHALSTLIGTQIQGVVGTQQDTKTKEQRWDEATVWSLPKIETLRVFVPGLFGFRMDTPDGGNYWGSVGQTPGIPQSRHSGSGVYGGILVALLAAFALAQAARKDQGPFSAQERRWIAFWATAALISLLLAFGRHAPFYQLLYQLPYFSTIRNPIKFMHPFSVALVTLFAYGLEAVQRRYLQQDVSRSQSVVENFRRWWKAAAAFERRWTIFSIGVLAAAGLTYLLYVASRRELEQYLQGIASERYGFPPSLIPAVSRFSATEIGWSVLFLAISVAAVALVMSGTFSGRKAKWAGVLLGMILLTDFARANAPWIVYYDYREKYATNPIIGQLSENKQERVAARVGPLLGSYFVAGEAQSLFANVVDREWLQHHFQYYRIQSLDIVQMPRMPELDATFLANFAPRDMSQFARVGRLWQLTNTRYVIGMKGFVDSINQQVDPTNKSFRVQTSFDFAPRNPISGGGARAEDITTVIRPEGQFAIFEFGAALPRAKLFSAWQVMTNDDAATLERLADPAFDPQSTVLVASGLGAAPPVTLTGGQTGGVQITHYEPKLIRLKADATAPSVLLLNDKYDPNWKVTVDGKPEALLRCNYIMRGVQLPAGTHAVEFRFDPPHWTFYVSLAALGVGLVLCALVTIGQRPTLSEPGKSRPIEPLPNPKTKG